jgi:hypothetical protein
MLDRGKVFKTESTSENSQKQKSHVESYRIKIPICKQIKKKIYFLQGPPLWTEFLATDPEIPGATRCSEK